MANIKSQKKRILTNAKRAERNKAVKSELKTRTKNAVKAVGTEPKTASALRSSASTWPLPRVSSTRTRPLAPRAV
jgi:small subunit ribosomal protein S20